MSGDDNDASREVNCDEMIKIKVSGQDLEKMEVAQLNCETEPRSKPSDLFEKLQEKRKSLHENVMKQLAVSLHEVNLRTEKNITLSSVELKAHTREFEKKLKAKLESIDNPQIASYCSSDFNELQNTANGYRKKQQHLLNEFYDDLISFENKRAKENAELLHVACEKIRKIGYFLPCDVQMFVESETLKLNQLSLNNRRCYEDLKLTLTLITEQTYKSFVDRVFCIRDNWVERKIQDNFYNSQTEEEEYKPYQKPYHRLELKGHELPIRVSQNGLNSLCTEEEWATNVGKILSIFDTARKNLIEIHKKAIKSVYNGFGEDVEEVKAGMGLVETLVISERVIKPLIIESQNCQTKENEELETHWQTSLEDIRTQLKLVKEFIKEVGKLWDKHVLRICESKKLILRALEKAEQRSQGVIQELEIKLNLGLDALRQEHNQSKLERNYENVVAILNELKAKYEGMYLDHVSIIEDFYKMMNLEASVLTADVNEFMFETSAVKFTHGFAGQFRYLRDVDIAGESILKDMKTCNQQIQNLKFWKQGIWIAFENLSSKTAESLKPKAEAWIKSKVGTLAEKKTIQLEILNKRFQRIKEEIYERRIRELKEHQEMFDKHKEKIWISLKKARKELQNLMESRSYSINEIKGKLVELENNALPVKLPGVVRGNKITIERKKAECEKELQVDFERFRAYCETRMTDNQQVNINFMKSLKLFHEGGNYSTEEGSSYMNMLEVLDREIITEIKSVVKDSAKEEHELLKKMAAAFNPTITLLGHLYEEIHFNQEVEQRLQNFTSQIQDSVKALERDLDIFKEHYNCVNDYVESAPGRTLDVSEDQLWNLLTQLLYKNVCNLLYPLQLPESPVQSAEGEEKETMGEFAIDGRTCCCAGKYAINIKNSKSFLQRRSRRVDTLSCQDFVGQLFNCEVPLKEDDTFMANMTKYFAAELTSLERVACDFYKKIQGRQIIRGDLIPDTYDNFIEGILKKFHHYTSQIQQIWLNTLLKFLPLLGQTKLLTNGFLLKKLNHYENSALSALKNYEAHFRDCIKFQNCENSKEFDALDGKLLPLYGYPHNEHLLGQLEETVVGRIANQEVQWDMGFKNFKSQLKCFRVRHTQQKVEIKKIERQYNKLRDTIFIENLGYNLLEELLNISNNGGFCRKNIPKNNFILEKELGNDGESSSSEVVSEENLLHFEKEKLSPVKDYLRQLRQIVERERLPDNQESRFTSSREESLEVEAEEDASWPGKLNILLDVIDFGAHALNILENIERYIRQLKSFAESQEKFREDKLFKWLNRWKFNVKKIQKLYRIKCEESLSHLQQAGDGEYVQGVLRVI